MTQTVLREEKPSCFGRIDDPSKQVEGWNPSCPSCSGGLDPTYTDERTGSHVREKCVFFQSCGATVQAKKMEQMRTTLVDPKSLIKPTVQPQPTVVPQPPTVPTPQYPASVYQQSQQKLAESLQQQQQALLMQQQQQAMMQQMAQMQRMMPQQMPQQMMMPQMMQMGYQQMMPVNYQMPAYLSSPEPMEAGGFWKMMGRTVFRSMGKSVGHSVAHIFDSVPFGGPTKPPGT